MKLTFYDHCGFLEKSQLEQSLKECLVAGLQSWVQGKQGRVMYVSGKRKCGGQNSAKKIKLRLNRCKGLGRLPLRYRQKSLSRGIRFQQPFTQGEEILLTMAELDINDLVSTTFSGEKLHHYTENGQRKIAKRSQSAVRFRGCFRHYRTRIHID